MAACDLKLKKLTPAQVQGLPDTNDENGARRLYLLMELARNRDDGTDQQRIVTEMETRFTSSPWLAEALYSSGNMYLLKKDYPKAVEYYRYLAAHFPGSKNAAAAHWRAGWLCYREGLYAEAANLFDEQIKLYPAAAETVGALYWRGGSMRRRTTTRRWRRRIIGPSCAHTSTIFMRRWRGCGWLRWEHTACAGAATGSLAAPAGASCWWIAFRRIARTWPRRGCWPTRG